MKTVLVSGVFALGVVFGGAADARNYHCEFQKDGAALHKCAIDSANNQACAHDFSANLRGVCAASGTGTVLLLCAITTPAAAAASYIAGLPQGSVSAAARALAQKPGFLTGGLTLAPENSAVVAGVYVEKEGAPTLAGVCTP